MSATAKYLATLPGWHGEARVYELDPPLDGNRHVIVSAVVVTPGGPETYIFPAKGQGDSFIAEDYLELDGSFRGELDHEQALGNAGYEVIS